MHKFMEKVVDDSSFSSSDELDPSEHNIIQLVKLGAIGRTGPDMKDCVGHKILANGKNGRRATS